MSGGKSDGSGAISKRMVRDWFLRSVSCSEATFTILNRGAGLELDDLEQAAHTLSGGFMMQGHACGMIWGTGLAIGARAVERFDDAGAAGAASLSVMMKAAAEFEKVAGSIDCRDIIDGSLETRMGRLRYVMAGKANLCTRLAIKWAHIADELIDAELAALEGAPLNQVKSNCAAMALERCVDSLEIDLDPAIAAAFAGGVGLRGNVCGALAASAFAHGVKYYQGRKGPRDSMVAAALQEFDVGAEFNKAPRRLADDFTGRFGSVLCSDICGREFPSPDELSRFIEGGGCAEAIGFASSR